MREEEIERERYIQKRRRAGFGLMPHGAEREEKHTC